MASKSEIRLTSKLSHEFISNITLDNIIYLVQTEDMGTKSCIILTNIYLKGEIVFSRKSDYAHLIKLKDFPGRLSFLIEKQHKSTAEQFIAEKTSKQKLKSEYFDELQQLLRRGDRKSALTALRLALDKFPADPFLLSYYGCLLAVVENKSKEGVKICEDAIKKLKTSLPFGSEFFYPTFYLNLGRAYLKDKKKKDAVQAFHEGLKSDPDSKDILWELKKLGIRRPPPLPFFVRSNPLNKYVGKLFYNPSGK